VTPEAITGPEGEPWWIVINDPAMLAVLLYTVFAATELSVEYSTWKEQVEIVDTPAEGAVTLPNALDIVHWLAAAPHDEQAIVVVIQLEAKPHELFVFQCA